MQNSEPSRFRLTLNTSGGTVSISFESGDDYFTLLAAGDVHPADWQVALAALAALSPDYPFALGGEPEWDGGCLVWAVPLPSLPATLARYMAITGALLGENGLLP